MACIRVLIVDNDVLVRENLVAYLEDEGMTVDAVSSGEDALALLRTRPRFDVCVLDMRLPGMDGNASIRAIHGIAPGMGLLIHTGSADYSPPADLQRVGIGDSEVFRKPLRDMAPLARAIRALVCRAAVVPGPSNDGGASNLA